LRDVHLVGCSLGGWIAAEIATRTCERIASLSLMAPFGLRQKGVALGDIFIWTPEENITNRLYDPALAERYLAAASEHTTEQATAYLKDRYATARLCWHPRFHNPELERWLHRIERPVQLIWGDSDRIVPREMAVSWQQRLPQAKLTIIDRCGHLPHLEHAAATAETVRSFIREVRP
jgi:pimeloyl-ACP methyl ester carboxylesterase